jgi:hypothetical protein
MRKNDWYSLMRIHYMFQKGFIQGKYYCIVDFYLPKPYNICIEIDGKYNLSDEFKGKMQANNEPKIVNM